MTDKLSRDWFRAQGAIGGKKRSAGLTKAERVASARRAARARWRAAPRKKVAK